VRNDDGLSCAGRYASLQPRFSTDVVGGRFASRVFMPIDAAVPTATGQVQPRKEVARASACLEMCRLLHQVGCLGTLPAALCEGRRSPL
jgi:Dicer dimerisation domain